MKNTQTPTNSFLSLLISQYHTLKSDIKSAIQSSATKLAQPYLLHTIRNANDKMYRSLSFQTGITNVVKDLSPEQFLTMLKNVQTYRPARSPFLSERLNTELDDLFEKNISLVYLKTNLCLNRRDVKLHEAVLRQLESLNKEQLQRLIQQMSKNQTPDMQKEICLAMQATDAVQKQEQKIKTHRTVQTLATLGAIATLAFGLTHAKTKGQKETTAMTAAALTTLAVGEHLNKKKWQEQNRTTNADIQKQPKVFRRFQQIQTIIHDDRIG